MLCKKFSLWIVLIRPQRRRWIHTVESGSLMSSFWKKRIVHQFKPRAFHALTDGISIRMPQGLFIWFHAPLFCRESDISYRDPATNSAFELNHPLRFSISGFLFREEYYLVPTFWRKRQWVFHCRNGFCKGEREEKYGGQGMGAMPGHMSRSQEVGSVPI